jgi:hypothetical protein
VWRVVVIVPRRLILVVVLLVVVDERLFRVPEETRRIDRRLRRARAVRVVQPRGGRLGAAHGPAVSWVDSGRWQVPRREDVDRDGQRDEGMRVAAPVRKLGRTRRRFGRPGLLKSLCAG